MEAGIEAATKRSILSTFCLRMYSCLDLQFSATILNYNFPKEQ